MTEAAERTDVAHGVARFVYPLRRSTARLGLKPAAGSRVAGESPRATTEDVSAMFVQMTEIFRVSVKLNRKMGLRSYGKSTVPVVRRMKTEPPRGCPQPSGGTQVRWRHGCAHHRCRAGFTFRRRLRAKNRRWQLEAEQLEEELRQLSAARQKEIEDEIRRVTRVFEFRPLRMDLAEDEGELDELGDA